MGRPKGKPGQAAFRSGGETTDGTHFSRWQKIDDGEPRGSIRENSVGQCKGSNPSQGTKRGQGGKKGPGSADCSRKNERGLVLFHTRLGLAGNCLKGGVRIGH